MKRKNDKGTTRSKMIGYRTTESEWRKLKRFAAKRKMSMASVIELALEMYYRSPEND